MSSSTFSPAHALFCICQSKSCNITNEWKKNENWDHPYQLALTIAIFISVVWQRIYLIFTSTCEVIISDRKGTMNFTDTKIKLANVTELAERQSWDSSPVPCLQIFFLVSPEGFPKFFEWPFCNLCFHGNLVLNWISYQVPELKFSVPSEATILSLSLEHQLYVKHCCDQFVLISEQNKVSAFVELYRSGERR